MQFPEKFGNFRKSNILKWGCRNFRKNKGYFPEIPIFDDQTTSKIRFMHFYKHPVGKRKIKKRCRREKIFKMSFMHFYKHPVDKRKTQN